MLGALIETALKLPSASYEPGDSQSTVRKIVDAEGQNAGYLTFVEAMMAQLEEAEAFRIQYHEELISLAPTAAGEGVVLTFASGLTVNAAKVLLNLPQLPLLRVLGQSPANLFGEAGLPPALQVPALWTASGRPAVLAVTATTARALALCRCPLLWTASSCMSTTKMCAPAPPPPHTFCPPDHLL